jgi:hypothetical protein
MIKVRHLRHRTLARVRHSKRLGLWLNEQATRLEITVAEVFALLKAGSYQTVEATPTPEPEGP